MNNQLLYGGIPALIGGIGFIIASKAPRFKGQTALVKAFFWIMAFSLMYLGIITFGPK